jgi:hypothetical protein
LQLFKNYYNKYNNIKQMEVAWNLIADKVII